MTKLVINKCYGGFSISPEAALWLFDRGYDEPGFKTSVEDYWTFRNVFDTDKYKEELKEWKKYIKDPNVFKRVYVIVFSPDERFVLNTRPSVRDNPLLVECVETLGDSADGVHASLAVVKIPDGVTYEIEDYDGIESIHESHRSWG